MAKSQIASVIAVLTVFLTASAGAESWYPRDCIAIDYCVPLENITRSTPTMGATPQIVISSANRSAVVQRNFAVFESQDQRAHVCMRYDSFGDMEVTCLLLPFRAF